MVDLGRTYHVDEIFSADDYLPANYVPGDEIDDFDAAPRIDAAEAFRADMEQKLGSAPRAIIGDGKIHRFSTSKRKNDDAGWYRFFDDDFPAGSYGDWRTGETLKWRARETRDMSLSERQRLEQVKIERERRAEEGFARAATEALAIWDRAAPASHDHPYLKRKGVAAHGVVERGGKLIVPVVIDGDLASLQFIGADGSKKFLSGGKVSGGHYIIGEIGDEFIIGEGFATCATLHEATGLAVVVAFNSGNLAPVAKKLREIHPSATIIVAADDDIKTEKERGFNPGLRAAEKAAEAVRATVAAPPFDRERDAEAPSDWNDFAALHGADAVKEAFLPGGGGERAEHDSDPLAGFVFDGSATLELPPMLVKKLVPLDGVCFIGGQSGAGKTFIAVDLAVSLASGEPFFGHKVVERVGAAIFAAEGASTIASRVTVARNHKARGEILPIAWLGAVPNLADGREVKAMVQRLRAVDARFRANHGVRLGAVICDTLAASFSLDDENNNSEAAKAIRSMKIMGDALGVVMLPIHHFGKAAETGLRGASAWRAGCDTVLSVLADRDQTTGACSNRRLALTKSRVGEEGWVAPFHLCFVGLGEDDDGEAYGACYVEQGRSDDDTSIISKPKEKGPPRAAKVYLDAFSIVVGDKGKKVRPFGSEGTEVVAVDREDIRAEFYRLWAVDGESEEARAAAQRQSFRRGEDWALDNRRIASYAIGKQHMVWLLKEVEARATAHHPNLDLGDIFVPEQWL
ncbi:AAA family ATPase [Methylocystis sp.]|uniref:AAA family ATPase n=1 Tax=Methylocystis sp. TaxID=1911079 RepID=UPI002733E62E|nr:AAA family ATPase [Methylocystis sp.]MDP3552642.1 AAA family ATPase [Methylocystis sp.]